MTWWRLASGDLSWQAPPAGKELGQQLPVYLYGAAHPQQRSLAALRRSLGYFRGGASGVRVSWHGSWCV